MNKFLSLIFLSLPLIATDNNVPAHDDLEVRKLVHDTNPLNCGYAAYDKNNHRVSVIYKESNQDGTSFYNGAWDASLNISHLSREEMFAFWANLYNQQNKKNNQ